MKRQRAQAGQDVVQGDHLRGTALTFHADEQLGRLGVLVDRDVQGPLAADLQLLGDVLAAVGEGPALTQGYTPASKLRVDFPRLCNYPLSRTRLWRTFSGHNCLDLSLSR